MTQLSLQPSTLAWVIVGLALIALVHSLLSYARARPAAGGRWVRAMSLLRVATLALLVLAGFQPMLLLPDRASSARTVVAIVDDSRSMGVVDTVHNTTDLLDFAQAVGELPQGQRDRPTRRLLQAARTLPAMIEELHERRQRFAQAKNANRPDGEDQQRFREQADALKTTLVLMLDRLDDSTRFAEPRLRQLLELLGTGKLGPLDKTASQLIGEVARRDQQADEQLAREDADVAALVARLGAASRFELARIALRATIDPQTARLQAMGDSLRADALQSATPDRAESPLLRTLLGTIERLDPRGVEAVVLFTDGRSTEPTHAVPPLLSAAGVRVYPVLVAPRARQPDVRVVRVEAPATALAGETLQVAVHVRSRGADGATVKLHVGDGSTTLTRDLVLRGEDVVDVSLPAVRAPGVTIQAAVDPLRGELITENNSASAQVNVVERKLRVMLIAGSLGWDAQYLRNILTRTPWVELAEQTLRPGDSVRFDATAIEQQDVIILAGAPASALSSQQADAIHRAVSELGHSALLLDCDPDLLDAFARQPLLATLLPYRIDQRPTWRQAPADEPTILAVPSKSAAQLPLLRLDETLESSLAAWLARPRLFRAIEVGQLKPQAAALLVDRATQTPLLIEHTLGAGRTALLTSNELWRWRRDLGADVNDRFWLQLVRHLIEPPYDVSRDGLSLGVDRRNPAAGQTVDVRARVPADTGAVSLHLRRGGQTIQTLPMTQAIPGSGRWTARMTPESAGAAQLVLRAGAQELEVPLDVQPADEAELADVAPDPALLARIASATGGQMLTMAEVGELPELLKPRERDRDATVDYALWSSPYLFAMIVGCLGLEWALRKQKGLV